MELKVVLKAYKSYASREKDVNPTESKMVSTVAEFDVVEIDFASRGFYVGYFSESGAKLKRDGAHYILARQEYEDNIRSSILAATAWIEENRTYISKYLKDALVVANKIGEFYFVSLGIQGPKGYEYYFLKVDLKNRSVELVETHR